MAATLYIVMRSDLKMGRGKEIAQAIHAFRYLKPKMEDGTPVVCVRADSWADLSAIVEENAEFAVVHDAGRTHNPPGTVTCAAIWCEGEPGPLLAGARLY